MSDTSDAGWQQLSEVEQALIPGQWQFVDQSGDGGPFGFHFKSIQNGKYILTLATSGEDTAWQQDYLWPITAVENFRRVHIMISMWHNDNFTPLPTKPYDDDDGIGVQSALGDGPQWETLFETLGAALTFADWLANNLK